MSDKEVKEEKKKAVNTTIEKSSEKKKSTTPADKVESTIENNEETKPEKETSDIKTEVVIDELSKVETEDKVESTIENDEATKPEKETSDIKTEVVIDELSKVETEDKEIDKEEPITSIDKKKSAIEDKDVTAIEKDNSEKEVAKDQVVAPIVKPEEKSEEEEDSKVEKVKEESQKDLTKLSEKDLIEELQTIIQDRPVQEIKNEVEEIKTEFNSKFNEELEKNKEEFLSEGGNIIDFYYTTPLKKEFDSIYYGFKDKRNRYYINLKKDLKVNLNNRLELIEELKSLFNEKENTSTIFKHFKNIQERWFEAGAIPRDKYNTVWNNYHHHVENFYDILHLDREFRDRDFKNNLEQKLRLIGQAEELTLEENSNKAFRELQLLHKMWKEEIGPVAKEYSDDIWEKFSAATKTIHDKRHLYQKELEKEYEGNIEIKKELINEINLITNSTKPSHQSWQNTIKKVQELREQFFVAGKVPRSSNKEIWGLFKDATSTYNKKKNTFYKNQKKEQYVNLEKKLELIKIADENKDNEDFEVITPIMKKIQNDWKNIGHVPRKDSDKIWKEFKAVCNHYFNRLHSKQDDANKEEFLHLDAKKELLENLSSLKFEGDNKKDIKKIKEQIAAWKEIGRVPYNKRNIEQKFNKKLDNLFGQLKLDKKEIELIKFENKLTSLISQDDERKLRNEEFFISKKVDESKVEIRQLENNLGFFQHVDDNNPLVQDVHKKINKQKEQLEVWKAKLKKIRKLRKDKG